MHQHFVQLAHALPQRGQVYHLVEEVTDLQLYVDVGVGESDSLAILAQHSSQIQVHPLRLGAVKLPTQDEN